MYITNILAMEEAYKVFILLRFIQILALFRIITKIYSKFHEKCQREIKFHSIAEQIFPFTYYCYYYYYDYYDISESIVIQ